jgi:hypothetical protein
MKDREKNLENSFERRIQEMDRRQKQYEAFIESIQELSPLDRSEAWLKYIADNMGTFGEQEALVYLRSRGYECSKQIRHLLTIWKRRANEALDHYRIQPYSVNKDTNENNLRGKKYSRTEALEALENSFDRPPDFWGGNDYQDLSIEATMLRTVEWCNIGGFEAWWERLAKVHYDLCISGTIQAIPMAFFLFNICRSNYAIELMHRSLVHNLEALEYPEPRQIYPWRRWNWETEPPQGIDHLAYAASVVFANQRLCSKHPNAELVDQALETLLGLQNPDGSWNYWADDERPSIQTTAMAIHALALTKPRGWELAVGTAKDWLLSVQDRAGCWGDAGCPDQIYLTVLVLDALELANGGARVTFGLISLLAQGAEEKLQDSESQHTDRIKILFLSANPNDLPKLDLDKQIRLITDKIRASEHRDLLELKSSWAVRPDDLLQTLNEYKPHIVHFSGHGSNLGEVFVIGSKGEAKAVSKKALMMLFTTLKDDIRVVILDACYSRDQAEAIAEVIDCVIGMREEITQEAAMIFTASFYRALGFGRSVQHAFDQGIIALLLEGIPEEDIPQLFSKARILPSEIYLIPQ